MLPHRNIQK